MQYYTEEELADALRVVDAGIRKYELAKSRYPISSPHHALLRRRLKAMYVSRTLIRQALDHAHATAQLL